MRPTNHPRRLQTQLLIAALVPLTVAACVPGQEPPEAAPDLREGGVYSMSNAREGNEVVAFSRASDGTLTRLGAFPTGGTGSGSFEDSDNGLILGSAQGEAAPNNLIETSDLLFATNAGSNSISVFRVEGGGLERVEVQDSGGEKPVSVTVNRGLLYVLNSGETEDDLFDENGDVIAPNCSTGSLPTITGFTVGSGGQLDPVPNSTQTLSGDAFSGCAQVSFNPQGNVLVVTERTAVQPGGTNDMLPAGDEGVIVTFTVNGDGTLGNKQITDATGQGPFGFAFTKQGLLLTTEQFDGPDGPGLGAAAAYSVADDGSLTPTSDSVANGGTDTCWFVVTDDGALGFATSFFGDGRISSYRVGQDGSLELLEAVATVAGDDSSRDGVELGASDISLSGDSRYLYQLNSFGGTINVFEVHEDGTLTSIQQVQAHDPSDMAARLGMAAF